MKQASRRGLVAAAIIVIAVIIYGSLFDFTLRRPISSGNPLLYLLGTWNERPSGRGDILANVLLYMPFGFFVALALPERIRAARRILFVTLGGLALCTSVELTQFYIVGRVTSMSDVYTNTAGSLLGAAIGTLFGAEFRWPLLRDLSAKPFPALLLGAWLGYRLYPYVPTIDLHKYWRAIKPLLYGPAMQPFEIYHYATLWLVVAAILASIYDRRRFLPLYLLVVAIEFVGKIFVIDTQMRLADVLGAAAGLALWLALGSTRRRMAIVTALWAVTVIALRLQPAGGAFSLTQFDHAPHGFVFIPFASFMRGSLEVDIQSFLEKFFLYGGLLWLMVQTGWRLGQAAFWVAAIVLLTSIAEIYLPGRSAELTDAAMVLVIAVVYRIVEGRRAAPRTGVPVRPRAVAVS